MATKDVEALLFGINAEDLDDLQGDDEVDVPGKEAVQAYRGGASMFPEPPPSSLDDQALFDSPVPSTTSFGFTTGGGSKIAPPSMEAIKKAQRFLLDDEELPNDSQPKADLHIAKRPKVDTSKPSHSLFTTGSGHNIAGPSKSALDRVASLFADEAPTPASPGRLHGHFGGESSFNVVSQRPLRSNLPGVPSSHGFRTPLVVTTNTHTNATSSTPLRPKSRAIETKPPGSHRRIGLASPLVNSKAKPAFIPPLKHSKENDTSMKPLTLQSRPPASDDRGFHSVFDLTPQGTRKSWKQAFLKPQYNSAEEMMERRVPQVVLDMDPELAEIFAFNVDNHLFGVQAALSALKESGCRLCTLKWVSNHWRMILWKLSGQIKAEPGLLDAKWTFDEVLLQLKYRYEREINRVQRSIVHKIHEQDASPSHPMVLCISNVVPIDNGDGEDASPASLNCLLELTDGWYRILAQVDAGLSRAINRGIIAIGRKLGICGARLSADSEAHEPLDGLDQTYLVLSGNSCSLAPWDAKLGFQVVPFVASLTSLSADGGVISSMHVVIDKSFPLAFMSGDKGKKETPWDEAEEARREAAWMDARENEAIGIQEEVASLREAGSFDQALELEAQLEIICAPRLTRSFRLVRIKDAWQTMRDPTRIGMLTVWDAQHIPKDKLRVNRKYHVTNLKPGKPGEWTLGSHGQGLKEIYLHTRRDTRWTETP